MTLKNVRVYLVINQQITIGLVGPIGLNVRRVHHRKRIQFKLEIESV